MKRLCVFCGSSSGVAEKARQAATQLGTAMARKGMGLVFGAGRVGLMGRVADAVLAGGGEAIGVIPRALVDRELAHPHLTHLHIVDTMHQRKALMADLAEGFVALPGGFGTADELFEILTWAQLGIHSRPIGLLNVDGFFDSLLTWIDRAMADGFLSQESRALLLVVEDVEQLLEELPRHRPGPGRLVALSPEQR